LSLSTKQILVTCWQHQIFSGNFWFKAVELAVSLDINYLKQVFF